MKRILLITCLLAVTTLATQAKVHNAQVHTKSVIFIDFDGQTLRGSSWNWSGPLYLQSAGLSRSDQASILAQVAEDFKPFQVLITSDSTQYFAADRNKRIRVIVTPDYQWYEPAAGASMMGSFHWGDETPAFVFSSVLGNQPSWIAESISHQVGHTMGLAHQVVKDEQGKVVVGQDGGEGKGCTGWAPIMGVSFYKNRTTWHTGWAGPKGEIWQDEMARIAAAVGGIPKMKSLWNSWSNHKLPIPWKSKEPSNRPPIEISFPSELCVPGNGQYKPFLPVWILRSEELTSTYKCS